MIALGTRRRTRVSDDTGSSALLSSADWRKRSVRWGVGTAHVVLLIVLVIVGLGPIALAREVGDHADAGHARNTDGAVPARCGVEQSARGVVRRPRRPLLLEHGRPRVRLVALADRRRDDGGFALSVLRPKYGKILMGLVLATLFVPAVVLLVPLYVEIVHPPLIHHSFIDSYWAIWLPAGASAFNVVLVKRFFDNLPREIFEAARIDGAGPFRLFWSVVLPMSKPILGVVSVFAILASWKDFLWPLLVLTNPNEQPLSVRLPTIQAQTELGVFLAALFIASLVPIIGFLIFQRSFLRGSGLGGAIKG